MPRAVVLRGYGPPEAFSLADLPRPRLSAGELRVRTIAAGVNRTDIEIRAGNWPIQKQSPFPYVPGIEVVGQVIELGPPVVPFHKGAPFQKGDHVIAMMMGMGGVRAERSGGYQDEVVLRAADCSILPIDIDPLAVAAIGVAGVTALHGFDFVGAGPDRRVLVTGAGGGVGTCAIRIGKALGTEIVAVTRDARKVDALRGLGADRVVVAESAGELPKVTGVLDTVGGALFGRLVEALEPGGKLCFLGGAASDAVEFSAWHLMEGIVLGGWSSESLDGAALRSAIGRLTSLMRHGSLSPPPVTRFPLGEVAAAHRALALSQHVGRVLLTP